MKSLRYQYDQILKKSARWRQRSDRKRASQKQAAEILARALRDYIRKTNKRERAA